MSESSPGGESRGVDAATIHHLNAVPDDPTGGVTSDKQSVEEASASQGSADAGAELHLPASSPLMGADPDPPLSSNVECEVCPNEIMPKIWDTTLGRSEGATYPDLIYDRYNSKCLRCHFTLCNGVNQGCILQGDAFPSRKRDQICVLCPHLIHNKAIITILKRGPFSGNYVHAECGWRWLYDNPATSLDPHFEYVLPAAPLRAFIQVWAAARSSAISW